jgi:membrane AbrB-like protein
MGRTLAAWVTALAAGLAGAGLAAGLGLPAGALIGSTLAVALAAALRLPVAVPERLRDLGFAVIGISLGSGVTREVWAQVALWGMSLAILVGALVVTMLAGVACLTRLFGLDARTATLASAPGTMSNVLAIAAEGRADATAVMVLQLMRLLILVLAVPPLASIADPAGSAANAPAMVMGPLPLAGLVALAMAAGMAGARLGVPAACLLAGMVTSALAHAMGIVQGAAPGWAVFLAFALTGAVIGARIRHVALAQLGRFVLAGAVSVALAIAVSVGFAWLAAWLTALPFGQVWIAYAPGGVEAMAAIGLALGYDPAFVALHHFARIAALVVILPVMLHLIAR